MICATRASASGATSYGPTVLIADDDEDMRVLLRALLSTASSGIEVVAEATDGCDAIETYLDLRDGVVPDVVVLDNRMPGCTGMEVADCILAEVPDQRIVLFSAFLTPELERDAASLGISRCVAKNDFALLPAIVDELAR
jgi:DNA-binding NarL/FixJ family response regulator